MPWMGSSADVDAPLNEVCRHIDSGHVPRCPTRPRGAIDRDAGADFEQTINDEFLEPANAFVSGSISACIANGIVGKRDASKVHR
jgi:hypothetical protein